LNTLKTSTIQDAAAYVPVDPAEILAVGYHAADQGQVIAWIQMEFPELRKRYWSRRFWARGYFLTTSSSITDDIIKLYLEIHSSK
jgi:putative transposase